MRDWDESIVLMYIFFYFVAEHKKVYIRWFRIFQTSRYQDIVKATVSGVFEDLNTETANRVGERPLMTSDDFGRFSTHLPTYVRFGPILPNLPI